MPTPKTQTSAKLIQRSNSLIKVKPPNFQEPEISIFIDPTQEDWPNTLNAFPTHMGKLLSPASKPRNYREYAFSLSLRQFRGEHPKYNFRMRGHLQPLEDGSTIITNWQLTIKTKGNGRDRIEYETDDNLSSVNLTDAFEALKIKYGTALPNDILSINPEDLYAFSATLNARIGNNGLHTLFNDNVPATQAHAMVNSDNVIFLPPEIIGPNGDVIILNRRPESEAEIKHIEFDPSAYNDATPENDEDLLQSLLNQSLDEMDGHARRLIKNTVTHNTSKIEEADNSVLRAQWTQSIGQRALKPEDYTKEFMQPALRALAKILPSPYADHNQDVKHRTSMINQMRANNILQMPLDEHFIALTAA